MITGLPELAPKYINSSDSINATSIRKISDITGGAYQTHDGIRDMSDVFGYPVEIKTEDYFATFRRMGIATRIARGVARSCWRDVPKIMVNDVEILETEINQLASIKLFRRLEQADTLNRIARFSVLYIGIPDGKDSREPLSRVTNKNTAWKATFFKAYREDGINVVQYDTEPSSPRYGMPVIYQLQVMDFDNSSTIASNTQTINVHHSRIVHLAEDALDNDFVGMSSLEPVYNFIIDLIKVEGGSSEAYWRNARRILLLMMKDRIPNTVDGRQMLDDLKTNIAEFTNGWSDALRLGNMDAKQLEATIADPKEAVLAVLKLISGATGIPIRILTGEGGGQTTGNEDKAAYNQIILDRQELICTDWLKQVLNILAMAGYFNELPLEAVVVWPVNESLNELQQSETRRNNAQGIALLSSASNDMGSYAGQGDELIKEIYDIMLTPVIDTSEDDDATITGLPELD